MKYLALFLLFSKLIFASIDSDFDGVLDVNDNCPDTLFSDLVDSTGCSIKSLLPTHKFDVVIGMAFSQLDQNTFDADNTVYKSYQIDYNYKNFTAFVSTSTYKNDEDDGFNDTILGIYYRFFIEDDFILTSGVEAIFPTYKSGLENEATDYGVSLELQYIYEQFSLFNIVRYTIIRDSNVDDIIYQNTKDYTIGAGYHFKTLPYVGLSYNYSNSIYKEIKTIENISLNLYYELDEHFFIASYYAYGLSYSASENFVSLSVGYNF